MEKIDFKKEWKELYNPSKREPSFVEVPAFKFLMIDGHGDPNNAPEYPEAISALYNKEADVAATDQTGAQQNQDGRTRDGQKRKTHILLEEARHAKRRPCGKAERSTRLAIEPLQHPHRNQNPEPAVAVVFGIRHDAVDAQDAERRGNKQRDGPGDPHARLRRDQGRRSLARWCSHRSLRAGLARLSRSRSRP